MEYEQTAGSAQFAPFVRFAIVTVALTEFEHVRQGQQANSYPILAATNATPTAFRVEFGHSTRLVGSVTISHSYYNCMRETVQFLTNFIRKLLRKLVGGWSLERKSLLFLGVALVVPIGIAFWFVLETVADSRQNTRQAAKEYADKVVAWSHATAHLEATSVMTRSMPALMEMLRDGLIENPNFQYQYVMLESTPQHIDLVHAQHPSTQRERELLEELAQQYRDYLAGQSEKRQESPVPTVLGAEAAGTSGEAAGFVEKPVFFRELEPFVPGDHDRADYTKLTPPEGWYAYYHAVIFDESCLKCHARHKQSSAEAMPFRAVKVLTPLSRARAATATTLAVMIAIGMVTVAATLLVVHWVFRRLVLMPLAHLKTVSDEITSGNINLRANIDTGDEFNELADAFNRMMRHMTESQDALQNVNHELDVRVDQLAQANLNLFEANRLKSDFLANMSHELRTPLNSIIGFSDVLKEIPALNDKQRRYASNIQQSGKHLLEMINDILDLAKVEAGKMTVTPTAFDVRSTISSQCDMLHSLIDEKNMDLQLEFDDEMPEVFQDQAKLQQILTNLLSNAIKFTPDGGLITVLAGRLDDEQFYMTVADTGVGIPESDFEFIFEKFRQSAEVLQNDGLTRKYAGTGLGLSIVKELCKLLGGEIRLTSQLGTGSRFEVVLPIHYQQRRAVENAVQ